MEYPCCAWCHCTTASSLLRPGGKSSHFCSCEAASPGSQDEQNKRAGSCFLVKIGLFFVWFVLKREINCLEAMKVFWLSDAPRRRWSVELHLFGAGSVAVSGEEGRSHLAQNTLHNWKWQTSHSYEMSPGTVNIHTEQSSVLFTSNPCKLLNDFFKTCWGKEWEGQEKAWGSGDSGSCYTDWVLVLNKMLNSGV